MKKLVITNEAVNAIAYDEIIKNHERKAKAAIKRDRLSELISEGVEPEIAKVMVQVGL